MPAARGKIIAFSGIGRPRQLFAALKSANPAIGDTITFRDHHRYDQRDVDRLLALKKQSSAESFVTTEKDLINLGAFSSQLSPLLTAKLRIELESPQQVVIEIIKTLEQRSGQQILSPA